MSASESMAAAAAAAEAEATQAGEAQRQNAKATEEQIQQCLRMLEGTSDEHKFAGLLMITKLARVDETRMRQVRQQVVAIVGASFFLRLISTRGDGNDGLSSFQGLGLNLIASFCEDPSVANMFANEKVVRFVLEQLPLLVGPVVPSAEDCISVMRGLAQNEEGRELLMQESVIARLVSTLKKVSRTAPPSQEGAPSSADDAAFESVLHGYWTVLHSLSTSAPFWARLQSYDFEFLCSAFTHAQGRVATEILTVFNNLLHLVEDVDAPTEPLSSRALSDLRVGAVRYLRTKWNGHERDACIRLVHSLMQQTGIAWMLPGTTLRTQEMQDDVSSGKFVLVVLKLVGIEIKLMLDEVELALMQMEEKAVERVDEELRQQQEVARTMAVLPICYGVVETVIAGLVSNADGAMVLPYDVLLQLKASFADTFTVVLEHLTAARDFMKTHRFKGLIASHSPVTSQLDAIVFASVRVISAWLAEDSDTCVEQVIDLLPFLVCYKPLRQSSVSVASSNNQHASDVDSDDEEVDSDDELDAVTEMMRTISHMDEDIEQIDQLHFLLPGLLQISALPEGAQVISEDAEVLRRLLGFCCTLCATISAGEDQFGGVPTLTLSLGILMNVMLLRSSSVEVTASGRASTPLPNAVEWYRALSFLLPVACASGSHLMTETNLAEEERGEDDRYVMVLHVACVILLIGSNFQDKKNRPCKLSSLVAKLATPFGGIVDWMMAHPPDAASESATDLLELCRGLALRSPLTSEMLA